MEGATSVEKKGRLLAHAPRNKTALAMSCTVLLLPSNPTTPSRASQRNNNHHHHPNPPCTTITSGFSIVPGQNNGPTQGPVLLSPLSVFSLSSVLVKEEELDGNHLVLSGQLVAEDNTISVKTLIDTGASGFAFIDEDFTRRQSWIKLLAKLVSFPCP
jgi:hypothetical protein